ncbi:MAG: translation initiation factor IF-2 [Crocinitomicaceae bacterium]|nr:translation initiation factor IF-2 [Crocinitomicaceae bacterium]|tara:strand:- start:5093 stop:7810 length:2718 start_codon:yes stop_codon:yes gene_type:complete
MADANKPVRLSKAAREFNLGIGTIVDFLETKGIQVEAKPNSKLDPEVYALVRSNFQGDKDAKEAAKRSSVSIDRANISIASTKKAEPATEESPEKIDLRIFKKEEVQKEEGKKERKKKLVKEKPSTTETSKEDHKEALKSSLKVIGKVDFKAQEKEAAEKRAAAEEARIKAKLESEKIIVKSAIKPIEQQDENTAEESSDIVKPKVDKLSGPKVVGKIELPVEKPKSSDDGKRKRVRVKKVDVKKQANASRQNNKNKKKGNKVGYVKKEVSQEDIQKEIRETLARLSGGKKSKSSKLRREKRKNIRERTEDELVQQQLEDSILKLTEFVTVAELASMMDKSPNDVISACMMLGIMVSINQRLDSETITMIAEDFGFEVEFVSSELEDSIEIEEDKEDDLTGRPPIVTVMGHVDHGKTSLLDYIRKANVIDGEAGGITQHIGSYSVKMDDGKLITFLDTPGHEAFTAMRARGAQITDLAIIVIASDDAVMPQTKEAIHHAQAADIPMIFALNKMDKETANPDKIKTELSDMNILVEDWGGKYQVQEISAKNGTNIDELLEKVILESEMLELKANPEKKANGTVVESSLDKGRGYVTNILVQGGTLRVGDAVLAGQFSGKIKAMFDERGSRIEIAGPSTPVSVLGFDGAPSAGDKFNVFEDEKEARAIATKRQQLQREQGVRTQKSITLEEIGRRIAVGEFKELNLIVKGDVDGSIEALSDSLQKLSTEKVQVNIIHKAVGQISESDVLLASASSAYIIGFQVRPSSTARKLAEKEEIQIKLYSVIYKAIEEMRDAMEGLLSAKIEENIVGTAEIRETFKISKIGTIAGCFVTDGKILRSSKVRILREGIVVYTGLLGSLKRFKDDVKDVAKGYECGLNIEKFNDIKVGDLVEAYEDVEVKQTLEDA